LYQAPAPPPDENKLVDTVRFTPLSLDQEKDAAFLEGLGYLTDTFTFIREGGPFDKQMWEFGVAVNKHMRRWNEDEDEEEDEEDDDDDEVDVISVDER
jgi:hypothetical protein